MGTCAGCTECRQTIGRSTSVPLTAAVPCTTRMCVYDGHHIRRNGNMDAKSTPGPQQTPCAAINHRTVLPAGASRLQDRLVYCCHLPSFRRVVPEGRVCRSRKRRVCSTCVCNVSPVARFFTRTRRACRIDSPRFLASRGVACPTFRTPIRSSPRASPRLRRSASSSKKAQRPSTRLSGGGL